MAAAGQLFGPEARRYADPATDLPVVRLTDPAFSSGMSAPYLSQFGRRTNFLLYWSDRSGSRQVFHLDLKTAESKQLTDAAALDPATIALSPDERTFTYFDGPTLRETTLGTLRTRDLYKIPDAAPRTAITTGGDGSVFFAQTAAGRSRVFRVSRLRTGPISEFATPVDLILARPRHFQMACRTTDGVWLMNFDGSGKRHLTFEAGATGEMMWAPSGRSIVYLHKPSDLKQLVTAREYLPDDNTDRLIAKTSQFATLAPNSDASVFVGASWSRASAYVLILLRVTRRELTLCEHRASDPHMAYPVFSPDSQSVFFVSDRDGKSAIYRIHIEKFVEQTSDETP
ncbi:MAG: hypothetical protein ABJC09_14580 [Terriglobia bacterium]